MVLSAVADFGISKLRDAISSSGKDGVLDMLVEAGIDTSDTVLNKVDGIFNEDGTPDADRVRGFWQEHFGKDEPEAETKADFSFMGIISMFSSGNFNPIKGLFSTILESLSSVPNAIGNMVDVASNIPGRIGNTLSGVAGSLQNMASGILPAITSVLQSMSQSLFGGSPDESADDDIVESPQHVPEPSSRGPETGNIDLSAAHRRSIDAEAAASEPVPTHDPNVTLLPPA